MDRTGALVERYGYNAYGRPLVRESCRRGDLNSDTLMTAVDRNRVTAAAAGRCHYATFPLGLENKGHPDAAFPGRRPVRAPGASPVTGKGDGHGLARSAGLRRAALIGRGVALGDNGGCRPTGCPATPTRGGPHNLFSELQLPAESRGRYKLRGQAELRTPAGCPTI